jgi:hypothetical protein
MARLQHFRSQPPEIEKRLREANRTLKKICPQLNIHYIDPNKPDSSTKYLAHYIRTDKPIYMITGTVSYKTLNERLLSSRHKAKYPDFTNPRPARDKSLNNNREQRTELMSKKLEFYFDVLQHMVDKDIRPLLNSVEIEYLRPGLYLESEHPNNPYLSFMGE